MSVAPDNPNTERKHLEDITAAEPIELEVISDKPKVDPKNSQQNEEVNVPAPEESQYLEGWRLYYLTAGLCLSLLLSTLETTIVSTSLVSITNALQGFENRDWVVTSYLLTYTGFLVIYAKLSDIFGSKFMMLLALLIFTVFSIACGAATGMTELIILRAFQGLGGSGIYSMVGVVSVAVIPPLKFGKYMAIISSVFAIASVLGPLLGGAINDHSTWRWVFLLNAPAGASATALIIFFLPSTFTTTPQTLLARLRSRFTLTSFYRLDLLGAALMLVASILLVYALEEAGTQYGWGSVQIVAPLVIAVVCWGAFVQYEILLEKGKVGKRNEGGSRGAEPIFPMRLLKGRVLVGMLLNAFLTGFPFVSIVITLPQRYQAINSASPTRAGLLLLPLLLTSPFSSGISGLLITNKRLRIPPFYLILLGSILQFLGIGLMCSLPNSLTIHPIEYLYEAIMGLGFGFVLTSLLTLIPVVVDKKHLPVILGAVTQVRVLGGTIGVAICTTVLNSYVKRYLGEELDEGEILAIAESLKNINALSAAKQLFVRETFARAYKRQLWVLLGFSGAVLVSCGLIWERVPRRVDVVEINEEIEEGRV